MARGFLRLARKQGRRPLASAVWPMAPSLLVGEPFTSAMALFFALVVVLAAGRNFRPTPSALATTASLVCVDGRRGHPPAVSWLLSVPYALVTNTGASEPRKTSAVNLLSHPLPHGSLLRLQDARPRVYCPVRYEAFHPPRQPAICSTRR